MTKQSELKSCPFCGSIPQRGLDKKTHCQLHGEPSQRATVYCKNERCSAKPLVRAGDVFNGGLALAKKAACDAWNTRVSTPSDSLSGGVEQLVIAAREYMDVVLRIFELRKDGPPLAERSIMKDDDALTAFDDLNNVGKHLSNLLGVYSPEARKILGSAANTVSAPIRHTLRMDGHQVQADIDAFASAPQQDATAAGDETAIARKYYAEMHAAFSRIMGDPTMPEDSTPEYDEWLFEKAFDAGAQNAQNMEGRHGENVSVERSTNAADGVPSETDADEDGWNPSPSTLSPAPSQLSENHKPYLKNRANGVDGHYCIARKHPKGFHEFYNKGIWCSAGEVFNLNEAK